MTQRGNRRQQTFFCQDDYRAYLSLLKAWCAHRGNLQEPDEEGLAVRMRKLETTGRPLGDGVFLERLSSLLSRDLLPKKPGPPKHTES